MSNVEQGGDRREHLELDVFCRLRDIWEDVYDLGLDQNLLATVGQILVAAYGRGYVDALEEPFRGQLCKDHGYRIPTRREFG